MPPLHQRRAHPVGRASAQSTRDRRPTTRARVIRPGPSRRAPRLTSATTPRQHTDRRLIWANTAERGADFASGLGEGAARIEPEHFAVLDGQQVGALQELLRDSTRLVTLRVVVDQLDER